MQLVKSSLILPLCTLIHLAFASTSIKINGEGRDIPSYDLSSSASEERISSELDDDDIFLHLTDPNTAYHEHLSRTESTVEENAQTHTPYRRLSDSWLPFPEVPFKESYGFFPYKIQRDHVEEPLKPESPRPVPADTQGNKFNKEDIEPDTIIFDGYYTQEEIEELKERRLN